MGNVQQQRTDEIGAKSGRGMQKKEGGQTTAPFFFAINTL